jgi:hypothetical protein
MIYRFRLNISTEAYLRYYQGQSHFVQVQTEEGVRIKFPAEHLRPHITHDGIQGLFELESTDQGKFIALRRISS